MSHFLYVVRFSDRRIKFGVSANVRRRMTYYRQEARRNNVDGLVWWSAAPFLKKDQALHAERAMRLHFRDYSREHQREWLVRPIDFYTVILAADELRAMLGDESEVEKRDLPYMGAHGQFQGLSA